jgi:hypothetical protein
MTTTGTIKPTGSTVAVVDSESLPTNIDAGCIIHSTTTTGVVMVLESLLDNQSDIFLLILLLEDHNNLFVNLSRAYSQTYLCLSTCAFHRFSQDTQLNSDHGMGNDTPPPQGRGRTPGKLNLHAIAKKKLVCTHQVLF